MRLRTSTGPWRATFLATLGFSPLVACSAKTSGDVAGAGSQAGSTSAGGSASGGSSAAGGAGGAKPGTGGAMIASGGNVTATGGRTATGGVSPSGGVAASGGGGVGGSAGAGGVKDDGGTPDAGHSACKNPVPRLGPDGKPTGFVDCEGGLTHRPEKRTCATSIPRQTRCTNPDGVTGTICSFDSDCTTNPNGYCQLTSSALAQSSCICQYGCRNDEDCGASALCGCGDPIGECAPTAGCKTDADCGAGLLCILTHDQGCFYTFACQTPKDTCASQADCDGVGWCSFVVDHHECGPARPCSTGRPFLVEGEARVARLSSDAAWASGPAPHVAALGAVERAALSAHYTEVALMEHASIAAFARFALELLSLGAPPELLADTHAAMADETIHAREAFALATAYAGHPVGPGRLAVERSLSDRTPLDVVRTAILEGCIGETVAALEAAEALAHATDPGVQATLSRVVRDETRHAELAFRFVQWALESGPEELRAETAAEFVELVNDELRLAEATEYEGEDPSRELLAHGLLGRGARALLRQRALSEVVLPCAMALAGRARQWRRNVSVAAPALV